MLGADCHIAFSGEVVQKMYYFSCSHLTGVAAIFVPNEKTYPVNVCFLDFDAHSTNMDGGANLIKEGAAGHLVRLLSCAVYEDSMIGCFKSAMRFFRIPGMGMA